MVKLNSSMASLYLLVQGDVKKYGAQYLNARMGKIPKMGFGIFLKVEREGKILRMLITKSRCLLKIKGEKTQEFIDYKSLVSHLIETRQRTNSRFVIIL